MAHKIGMAATHNSAMGNVKQLVTFLAPTSLGFLNCL